MNALSCVEQACLLASKQAHAAKHGVVQGIFVLAFGMPGLGLWGAASGSAMRPDAWSYLSIRGLGAPFTVTLLVLQVALIPSLGLVDRKM